MDAFDAVRVKWAKRIWICRLLGLGAAGDGEMLVRRKLGIGGLQVAVAGDEFLDVAWHGHAKSAFGVVPVKIHAGKFLPFQSSVMV